MKSKPSKVLIHLVLIICTGGLWMVVLIFWYFIKALGQLFTNKV